MNKHMKYLNSLQYARAAFVFVTLSLSACSSSGPSTRYYGLFPSGSSVASQASASKNSESASIGVSLVRLPGYLENTSVVSRSSEQRVFVSGYHAWAESLNQAVTRTIAEDLRSLLSGTDVRGYPWDLRTQPDRVLRVDLVEFDGERGGAAAIRGRWSLYDVKAKTELKSGFITESSSLQSDSYREYVAALNALLNAFSVSLANELAD